MDDLIREKEFEQNGKDYVVKAFGDLTGVQVKVFLGDNLFLPYTYSITWETNMVYKEACGEDGLDALIRLAMDDAKRKINRE